MATTIKLTAHTHTGGTVTISAPASEYHPKTGAPIVELKQMSDEQWNALAKKLHNEKAHYSPTAK